MPTISRLSQHILKWIFPENAEQRRRRLCDGLAIAFALAVLTFGLVRATNEYRWSGWAPGDAQTMAAAQHFADEGFIDNGFLTYYHPGYIGSIYTGEEVYSFLDGYYTHSPPFYALVNGLIFKAGGEHYECQAFSIFLSFLALIFFYTFACYLFKRPVALISTFVIGLSVVFLEHMDGLSPQTYDVFLVSATMALFVAAQRDKRITSNKRLKSFALVGVWLLVFLQACNSFEYIPFLQIFIIGYYILSKAKPFPYKNLALFMIAPVAAFSLHFAQVVWARDGIINAWKDILDVLTYRTVGQGGGALPSGLFPTSLLGVIDRYFSQAFGIGIAALLILFLFVRYLESYENPKQMLKFERSFSPSNVLLWLGLCFLAWRIAVAKSLEIYHPAHAFAFVGLLFGLMITLYISKAWNSFRASWLGRRAVALSNEPGQSEGALLKFGITSVIILIPIAAFLTNSVSYISHYPNEISPERTWGVHIPFEKLKVSFEVAKRVQAKTSYGDVVFHNLGNEWQKGAEVFPMIDEYMQRRGLVLGQRLQDVKSVPLIDGEEEIAYEQLKPSYARYFGGELLLDGLPDDGYLHTYVTDGIGDGIISENMVGIKNFEYRLAELKNLRENLIKNGEIKKDEIRYFALLSEIECLRPLGRYLLANFHSEKLTPNYTLVHLDMPNDNLPIPSPEVYWPLDLVPGARAWDVSGWDRHLALSGSYRSIEKGRIGSALEFEGDAVGENKLFGLYIEDELTISYWMYPFINSKDSCIITLGNNENRNLLQIGRDTVQPKKLGVKIGDSIFYSESDLLTNAWTHVAVTLNLSTQTVRIHLNGALDSVHTQQENSIKIYIDGISDSIQATQGNLSGGGISRFH